MKPGSWRPEKCGSIVDMRPGDMSTSVPSGLRFSTRFLHERETGRGRARVGEAREGEMQGEREGDRGEQTMEREKQSERERDKNVST